MLTEFCQKSTVVIANILHQQHREIDDSTRGHHQRVSTKTGSIILFVAEDEESLYSQQKQDLELTVAQIMSSLLQNSVLN